MLFPPTRNADLPHIIGDFRSIAEALDYAAQGETGICIYDSKGEVEAAATYRQMRERALEAALKLQSLGLKRGDRVALIAETSLDYFSIFYGCQYAGFIPCPLPYTAYLGGKKAYLARIKSLTSVARASLICIPQKLEAMRDEIEQLTTTKTLTPDQINQLQGAGAIAPLRTDETAYIQFSSGSTSEPKGVIVSQHSLYNNIRGILQECIRISPADRVFSWLPLYHDMGMVGFALAPLFSQSTVDYISPTSFARSPTLWLELMSRNSSAITYAPSFGYELSAKRFRQRATPLNLSALRLAGIGGDMIRPQTLEFFAETFSPSGFDASAFTPSYGMAESTLLISFSHGATLDRVDAAELEESRRAKASLAGSSSKTFVVCGKPLTAHELVIVDDSNNRLKDREVGHVLIRGPSLAATYMTDQGTKTLIDDNGFLGTGDMGYMVDRQVVVTGRHKEMILFNGRNIWPQDIEGAVMELLSTSLNCSVAFSIESDETTEIVVLVEHGPAAAGGHGAIKSQISAQLLSTFGIGARVELVTPRSLPYTSSGKLARPIAKQLFLSGELKPIG